MRVGFNMDAAEKSLYYDGCDLWEPAKKVPRRVDRHRDPASRENNLGLLHTSVLGPVGFDHYSIAGDVSNVYLIPFTQQLN
jgi:hypothetical protein